MVFLYTKKHRGGCKNTIPKYQDRNPVKSVKKGMKNYDIAGNFESKGDV